MSWTFCTSGAAVAKAGKNANSSITVSGAILPGWSDQVENFINTSTRKDWIAAYSGLGANFKNILGDIASDMIAMKIIAFDMSGYTSRMEAGTMLDFLRDNSVRGIEILKDDKNREVLGG